MIWALRAGQRSMAAAWTPAEANADLEVEGQAGVADGRYVLIIEQIIGLGSDIHPVKQLKAAAEVKLGVTVVEVAVGQQEAVAA